MDHNLNRQPPDSKAQDDDLVMSLLELALISLDNELLIPVDA